MSSVTFVVVHVAARSCECSDYMGVCRILLQAHPTLIWRVCTALAIHLL